jgi:hypothetical protein
MIEGRGERARETTDITIHDPDDVVGGVAGARSGERATGSPNTIYDLSSVLFHALQGGASYDTYIEDTEREGIEDAEREGDEELAEFFRRVREEDKDRAAEAQLLLADRTLTAPRTEDIVSRVATTGGAEPDLSPGTEPPGGLPDTESRTEEGRSRRVAYRIPSRGRRVLPRVLRGGNTPSPRCPTKISPHHGTRFHPMLRSRQVLLRG